MFHLESGDAYCLTKTNKIVKIENIMKCNGQISFIGRRFREKCHLFFLSTFFKIFKYIYCKHSWIIKKMALKQIFKKKVVVIT